MVSKLIGLEWKAFWRSDSFNMNLALKIILGIAAVFYSLLFLFMGIGVYYALKEKGIEPLSTINQFMIYWLAFDLFVKYFFQKLPYMRVQPLLCMPIQKRKIIHYLMGKTLFSFFNIYPAFFFLPFSIILIWEGYGFFSVLGWHLAVVALVYGNSLLILLANNLNAVFVSVIIIFFGLGLLQYYGILDITVYTAPVFQWFYEYPFLGAIFLIWPILLYRANFKYFMPRLNIEDMTKQKAIPMAMTNLQSLNKLGRLGVFLKNDIYLIIRNKRSRTTVLMSLFFIFYGFFFIFNPQLQNTNSMKIFVGLFVSGGFMFTFGGFVPSWDSAYYPLMMSQNIRYKDYLASKWWLITLATLVSMVVSVFYLFFGWEWYLAILACGIYNIGINVYIVLLSGAYVKTPIDLNSAKKAFGDKKAFNLHTILLAIPKIVFPIAIYYIFYWIFDSITGFLVLMAVGILGLAFKKFAFQLIEKAYKEEKYAALAAFKQRN